jgi:hypothetical protein
MTNQEWIDSKLADIATKLPTLVHTEPASFACGFNTGYKQALLDLDRLIEEGIEIRKSLCKCGDKYHDYGAICL